MPDLEGPEVVFSPVRSEFSLQSIPGPIPLLILLDTQIIIRNNLRTFKIDEHSIVWFITLLSKLYSLEWSKATVQADFNYLQFCSLGYS